MRVPDTEANYNMCICYGGDCPTYNNSGLSGGLFCSRGKSDQSIERSDCVCPDCPVQIQYGLTDMFYCDEGAAKD